MSFFPGANHRWAKALKLWWFRLFWKADPVGLAFFYLPLLVITFSAALLLDLVPYPQWVLHLAGQSTFRSAPLVLETWKWAYGIVGFALSIFSFSYSIVKEQSLSFNFTRSPIWRHLVAAYVMTLVLGLLQNIRDTFATADHDGLIGDLFFLAWFLIVLALAVIYVADQFRRLAVPDEFNYCQKKIEKYLGEGLARAHALGGREGVTELLGDTKIHFETMFQILGNFAVRDVDVLYSECLVRVMLVATSIVYALQAIENEFQIPVDYRKWIKFLCDKYCDHLLILSQKNHGLEVMQLNQACGELLNAAAVHDNRCLVFCANSLRAVAATLIQRKDRVTLMGVISQLEQLNQQYPTLEFSAALMYIFESILVEAGVRGDKTTINEILYRMQQLGATLPVVQRKAFYSILWFALLKSVEHSAHASTGAFLKTMVSRFDQRAAARVLLLVIAKYARSGRVPTVRVPVDRDELLRDPDLHDALVALNPGYELIQGSLDYCLEKLIFLWYGQQRYLIQTGVSTAKKPAAPQNLFELKGRYLKYFRDKLPGDSYGLHWATQSDAVGQVHDELTAAWTSSRAGARVASVASGALRKTKSYPFADGDDE